MESISRISGMLEAARDLTLEAAHGASTARPARPPRPLPLPQLKKLLESRSERDVHDGLRRVLTMTLTAPRSATLPLFTSVVNQIASPSPLTRKLVYAYLLAHAEHAPDTALLSINSIQRALSDPNPQARATALRVMSGIRVPAISGIVALAIKRGAADMHASVRRAAALACPKCYALDPATGPSTLEEVIAQLLVDKAYWVAGAAVAAWRAVCPDRWEMLHPAYRGLVRKLVDMDEWGQIVTLRVLTTYVRRCFPRRVKRVRKQRVGAGVDEKGVTEAGAGAKNKVATEDDLKNFYGEDDDTQGRKEQEDAEGDESSTFDSPENYDEILQLDPDLDLLLRTSLPLLQSRNSAVLVALARLYSAVDSPTSTPQTSTYLDRAVGPLVALLRSPVDIQLIALHNIVALALSRPAPFVPYAAHFVQRASDPEPVSQLKLELLTLLFAASRPPSTPSDGTPTRALILAELAHAMRARRSPALVSAAVRALARCARAADPTTAAYCLRLLLAQLRAPDARLVGETLECVRVLVQLDPGAHARTTVVRLARSLDGAAAPMARACIVWLVGEFAGLDPADNIAADVLRVLVKGFADEDESVKAQIVLLAAKVYVHWLNVTKDEREGAEAAAAGKDRGAQQLGEQQSSINFLGGEDEGGFADNVFDTNATFTTTNATNDDGPKSSDPFADHPIPLLWQHTLLLARYDTSYDLRDRARLYRALLATPSSTELATLLLLAPKPIPHAPSPSEGHQHYVLGSASLVVGEPGGGADSVAGLGLPGYEPLPDWVEPGREPNPKLRDEGRGDEYSSEGRGAHVPASEKLDEAAAAQPAEKKANGLKEKSLDDWLEESEGEQESEREGSEEEETETEEETEEETSEEETEEEESEGEERDRLIR
ncbi:adaptin N terminal region-domain-containing protein [Lineolata rhizophorae]|uniref:Adaptin N terminal region-domain-containing protein n=1 Tax=Lineolata rhizophorae TaxID=578093 RepID=A0A6A6P6H8_9PEZI|nr:adaptin N terminal region-domain-containing protein [Lineolata rhizophorae]